MLRNAPLFSKKRGALQRKAAPVSTALPPCSPRAPSTSQLGRGLPSKKKTNNRDAPRPEGLRGAAGPGRRGRRPPPGDAAPSGRAARPRCPGGGDTPRPGPGPRPRLPGAPRGARRRAGRLALRRPGTAARLCLAQAGARPASPRDARPAGSAAAARRRRRRRHGPPAARKRNQRRREPAPAFRPGQRIPRRRRSAAGRPPRAPRTYRRGGGGGPRAGAGAAALPPPPPSRLIASPVSMGALRPAAAGGEVC